MGYKATFTPEPPPIHPVVVRKAGRVLARRFRRKADLTQMVDILGLKVLLEDAEKRSSQLYQGPVS